MSAIPVDPEEHERHERDPAVYDAIEHLQDSREALTTATADQAYAIGMRFDAMHEPTQSAMLEKGWDLPALQRFTLEKLREAPLRVERAQAQWAAAVNDAEALLRARDLDS